MNSISRLVGAIAVALLAGLYGLWRVPAVSAQSAQPGPRPAWLHDMPIVMVSNHDCMPTLRVPAGARVAGVTVLSPDRAGSQTLLTGQR